MSEIDFDSTEESAEWESISEDGENVSDTLDEIKSDNKLLNKINMLKDTNGTTATFTQIWLKDCHLQTLGQCTALVNLELYDCINLHGKLDFLHNLTNLQSLSLPFSGLHNEDIEVIKFLPKLTNLDLHQNFELTTDIEKYVIIHPTLNSFSLKYNKTIHVGG